MRSFLYDQPKLDTTDNTRALVECKQVYSSLQFNAREWFKDYLSLRDQIRAARGE